jgi:hypothetical protein
MILISLGLFLFVLLWVLLLEFATGGMFGFECNAQCSLDEMNRFWTGCCCVECTSDGAYQNLPDGISADDPLPWWTCCTISDSYFTSTPSFMCRFVFFVNFWFWYYGYAFIPTSVVELSQSTNREEEEAFDPGPRTKLSGRVVRHVRLHSNTTQEQDSELSHTSSEYSATVELFDRTNALNTERISIPLKDEAAYHKLQEFGQARNGHWFKTKTTNPSDSSNGYHLITTGAENKNLLMYRPYSYVYGWRVDISFYGILFICDHISFWVEAPTQDGVKAIFYTNAIMFLLATVSFSLVGYHGKGGRIRHSLSQTQNQNQDLDRHYIEMNDSSRTTTVL